MTCEVDDLNPRVATCLPIREEDISIEPSGNEEIDFEGITNPSLQKISPADLTEELSKVKFKNVSPSPPSSPNKRSRSSKNKTSDAMRASLAQLITVNKQFSHYKTARLSSLSL